MIRFAVVLSSRDELVLLVITLDVKEIHCFLRDKYKIM